MSELMSKLDPLEKNKIIKSLDKFPLDLVFNSFNAYKKGNTWKIKVQLPNNVYYDGSLDVKLDDGNRLDDNDENNIFKCLGEFWHDWETKKSGVGAFNFLSYVLNANVDETLLFIKKNFLDSNYQYQFNHTKITNKSSFDKKEVKKTIDFEAPEKNNDHLKDGIDYLVSKRGLPIELVQRMVDKGLVYVNDKRSIVFLGDFNAELRSIDGDFKGASKNSNRDISGFFSYAEPEIQSKTIAITEAAVDALSYTALYPSRHVISSNGCGNFPLHYKVILDAFEQGYKVIVAMDADEAGDKASQKIFNAIYLRKVLLEKFYDKIPCESKGNKASEDKEKLELLDKWILQDKIKIILENKDPLLFFNQYAYQEKYHVRHKKTGAGVEIGPLVKFNLSRDVCDILGLQRNTAGGLTLTKTVSKEDFYDIKEKVDRERPLNFKDWNDELKHLGIDYIKNYGKCKENKFKTLPKIASSINVYRENDVMKKARYFELLKSQSNLDNDNSVSNNLNNELTNQNQDNVNAKNSHNDVDSINKENNVKEVNANNNDDARKQQWVSMQQKNGLKQEAHIERREGDINHQEQAFSNSYDCETNYDKVKHGNNLPINNNIGEKNEHARNMEHSKEDSQRNLGSDNYSYDNFIDGDSCFSDDYHDRMGDLIFYDDSFYHVNAGNDNLAQGNYQSEVESGEKKLVNGLLDSLQDYIVSRNDRYAFYSNHIQRNNYIDKNVVKTTNANDNIVVTKNKVLNSNTNINNKNYQVNSIENIEKKVNSQAEDLNQKKPKNVEDNNIKNALMSEARNNNSMANFQKNHEMKRKSMFAKIGSNN